MITFDRKLGILMVNGLIVKGVWSGHGDARNDPSREQEKGIGPLPAGKYEIGVMHNSKHLGPDVMQLFPYPSNKMFDRSEFFMHGDHANDTDFSASDGCIIAPHQIRQEVNKSKDRELLVT